MYTQVTPVGPKRPRRTPVGKMRPSIRAIGVGPGMGAGLGASLNDKIYSNGSRKRL